MSKILLESEQVGPFQTLAPRQISPYRNWGTSQKLTVIMRKKVKEKSAPGEPSDSWQSQKASRETRNAVRTLSRKSHRTKRCQLPCRRWTMASLWILCKQDIQTWSTPPTALRLTLSLLQTSPSQEQTSNLARWVTFSSKLSFCQIYWNKMKKNKKNSSRCFDLAVVKRLSTNRASHQPN